MAIQPIRLLGDPLLRTKCAVVRDFSSASVRDTIADLRDTLKDFRSRKGFGRGIAAPQIGVLQRIIYVDFEYSGPLINPKIVSRSKGKFELWDDCFSFPDFLVRVKRHTTIEVDFLDNDGIRQRLRAKGPLSELLQHEIDHIDGILALDRAISPRHIILRSQRERFEGQIMKKS